jgi:hypothetical protein
MNIYRKIAQMLRSANNYEAEDLIINSFIKIAQTPENVRVDPEYVKNLENQLYLLQTKAFNLNQENLQLKSMMLESQGNPLSNGLTFTQGVQPGEVVVQPNSPANGVTVRNPNNAPSSAIKIDDTGTHFNSSDNIQ